MSHTPQATRDVKSKFEGTGLHVSQAQNLSLVEIDSYRVQWHAHRMW